MSVAANTAELIKQARELCAAASASNWRLLFEDGCVVVRETPPTRGLFPIANFNGATNIADARFCAESRQLVPQLVEALERNEATLTEARQLLRRVDQEEGPVSAVTTNMIDRFLRG